MPYTATTPRLPFASDSDTSREAALRAERFVCEQGIRVLRWFEQQGDRGGTQKECADALNIGRASVCARVRALDLSSALVKTEKRRAGCVVYLALAK